MDYESNDMSSLKRLYDTYRPKEDIQEMWDMYQEEYMKPKYSENDVDAMKSRLEEKIEELEEENDNLESMVMSEVNKSLFTIIKERFINWLI